jgi:hypothetical protein
MTPSDVLSPNTSEEQAAVTPSRKDLTKQFTPRLLRPPAKYRGLLHTLIILLVILLILATVRLSSVFSGTNDQLLVRLGHSMITVDLRQSSPISPYLLGANAFPELHTHSLDQSFNGFMNYGTPITKGLHDAHTNLLRFPGGIWGEEHILSNDQLNAFAVLLSQVGAEGMVQARISGPITGYTDQSVTTLQSRANLAGNWVDYMNNQKSRFRTGQYAHAPFHRIKFWSVGNEPDLLINPDTRKPFTVAEYANVFIQFSLMMHQNDPEIKVFGPEISQFYGVGAGPKDSNGQLWMEGFLQSVHAYEKAHPELKFHLLDGVSIHHYPFSDTSRRAPTQLLSTPNEWNYSLPPLRQLIQQVFERDIPIAVTEINSSPTTHVFSLGMSTLWWANTLGVLMNQEAEYVAFFSTEGVDTPYPLFTSNALHETPMLRVMQLFSRLQHNLIPITVQDKSVNMYATQDDVHNTVSLLFINNSETTQFAQVSPQQQFFGSSNWHKQDTSLYRYSITVLTLHRGGGAEAHIYRVPAIDDANVAPLSYVVCDHQNDVLANEKPC